MIKSDIIYSMFLQKMIQKNFQQSDFLDDSQGGEWRQQQPMQMDTSQDTTQDYDVSDRQGQDQEVTGPQQAAGTLLSRYDVDKFRKSFLNIIYVAMLEEGYHKSYTEVCNFQKGLFFAPPPTIKNFWVKFTKIFKMTHLKMKSFSITERKLLLEEVFV